MYIFSFGGGYNLFPDWKIYTLTKPSHWTMQNIWRSPNGFLGRIPTLWVGFALGIQPVGLDDLFMPMTHLYEKIKSGTFLVPQLGALTHCCYC